VIFSKYHIESCVIFSKYCIESCVVLSKCRIELQIVFSKIHSKVVDFLHNNSGYDFIDVGISIIKIRYLLLNHISIVIFPAAKIIVLFCKYLFIAEIFLQ